MVQKREGIGKTEKEKREKERVKSLLLLRPINIVCIFSPHYNYMGVNKSF